MIIFPTVFDGLDGKDDVLLLLALAVGYGIVLTPVQQASDQCDDEHLQDQKLLAHHWGKETKHFKDQNIWHSIDFLNIYYFQIFSLTHFLNTSVKLCDCFGGRSKFVMTLKDQRRRMSL